MDVILRAWDDSQNYMAYQGTPDLETIQSLIYHFGYKELMLYSGMNDVNGKPIFQDDLIECEPTPFSIGGIHRVIFISGSFFTYNVIFGNHTDLSIIEKSHNKHYLKDCVANRQVKVIGNIHENKHLLK